MRSFYRYLCIILCFTFIESLTGSYRFNNNLFLSERAPFLNESSRKIGEGGSDYRYLIQKVDVGLRYGCVTRWEGGVKNREKVRYVILERPLKLRSCKSREIAH